MRRPKSAHRRASKKTTPVHFHQTLVEHNRSLALTARKAYSAMPGCKFGTSCQADSDSEMVFSLCGRSAAATWSGAGIAGPGAGCKEPCAPRLSKPDAVLSTVPGDDRGDAGGYAPEAVAGTRRMAVVPYTTVGDGDQFQRKLRIARSVHQGVPKGVSHLPQPVSPNGCDTYSPVRGERNSSLFR